MRQLKIKRFTDKMIIENGAISVTLKNCVHLDDLFTLYYAVERNNEEKLQLLKQSVHYQLQQTENNMQLLKKGKLSEEAREALFTDMMECHFFLQYLIELFALK